MANYKIHCPSCKEEVSQLFHDLCFKCLPQYKPLVQPTWEMVAKAKEEAREQIIKEVFEKEFDDINTMKKYGGMVAIVNHQTLLDRRAAEYFMLLVKMVKL